MSGTRLKSEPMNYTEYISKKLLCIPPSGLESIPPLPTSLFPHQVALVEWALRRGRCAIFADTGLGKTRMEIAWADAIAEHTGKPVLILAPLAVAKQTSSEGTALCVDVNVCANDSDVDHGVNVTNYDKLHRFDPERFGGVVLDESSIIKHHDAKTFSLLTEAFKRTPYRLAATATPAPNDWTEFGTHAEFLGICSRVEMLSEFFVHDGGETSVWRLKGHARHAFWKWVVAWGALIRNPADLGFDGSFYELPPLHFHEHSVECNNPTEGMLFAMEAQTLSERRSARRASIDDRVNACAEIVNAQPNEPWVIWCDLNDESRKLVEAISGAVEITGSDSTETKESRLGDFANGRITRLVSKPSICGWGLNWQHCARQAFVGVTDSWEAYYQAVRRSWRFGQKRDVHVHIFSSAAEGSIVSNLKRKERDAVAMSEALSAETAESVRASVIGSNRQSNPYNSTKQIKVPSFL